MGASVPGGAAGILRDTLSNRWLRSTGATSGKLQTTPISDVRVLYIWQDNLAMRR